MKVGTRRALPVAIGLAILVLIALIPFSLKPIYVILSINVLVTALLGVSFNLLYGYVGLFSFGQAAFYGVGAYGAALLINGTKMNFVFVLVLMALLTGVLGLITGVVLVGLDRIAFVMLTFALAELAEFASRRFVSVTRGDSGYLVNLPAALNIVGSTKSVYFVVFAVVLVTTALTVVLIASPFGRSIRAIKQNPIRAEAIGINVWRHRLITFSLAAAIAGVSGSLSAVTAQLVYPDSFGWLVSSNALVVTLLGGAGYLLGPVVGSALLGVLGLYAGRLTTNLVAVNGAAFLLIVLLAPAGLCDVATRVWRRIVDVVRQPRVPRREDPTAAHAPARVGRQ